MNTETASPSKARVVTLRYDAPVPYPIGYTHQRELREAVARGERADTLMLLEHTPTFTLGRNAHESHLLRSRDQLAALGFDVVQTDRGGDVTYHGPGQLVAYPILDLRRWRCSVSWYLRTLEDVIIDTLAQYNVQGERSKGFTGVWVNGSKIAAVGVGIRDWITYHGISINVSPCMEHWALIVPCGIADKPVISFESLLGGACPTTADAALKFERAFNDVFDTA